MGGEIGEPKTAKNESARQSGARDKKSPGPKAEARLMDCSHGGCSVRINWGRD